MSGERNALITGSSGGIGLAIARRFASAGMNVLLNGVEPAEDIEASRRDLEIRHGVVALYCQSDLTEPQNIRDLVAYGDSRLGATDVLVNNAGIQHVAPIDEFPEDKWDAIVAINLSAAFHATKAVLPGMKKRGWGRIVNIASVHGLVASPLKSAYVAAKHGLVGMTKAVAVESAEFGVTANAICPGYVWTPLVENQIPHIARERGISEQEVINDVILNTMPSRRFVTMDEIAEFALFLCRDNSSSMNGGIVPLDGGWTAQ